VRARRERVGALGFSDAVTFLDYLPEDALRPLYTNAAYLVLPSLGECFGIPVLEVMVCGTSVVTSNIPALREVAGDAALFADPYEAESIADAKYRVLSDRELREELRERGVQRAQAFSWKSTGAEISRLIDEVSKLAALR
jgi:glycosyltransferase involved in cell wall biosynthesis